MCMILQAVNNALISGEETVCESVVNEEVALEAVGVMGILMQEKYALMNEAPQEEVTSVKSHNIKTLIILQLFKKMELTVNRS